MSIIPAQFVPPIVIGQGQTQAYITPSNIGGAVIRRAAFANTKNAAVLLYVWWVPANSQPDRRHAIIFEKQVAGLKTYVASEMDWMVFWPGQSLWWGASFADQLNGMVAGFTFA